MWPPWIGVWTGLELPQVHRKLAALKTLWFTHFVKSICYIRKFACDCYFPNPYHRLKALNQIYVPLLSLSPRCTLMLVWAGCYDGTARIWDNRGLLIHTLIHHSGPVFALKWSKDGSLLLSGSYDKRVVVWDPVQANVVRVFMVHSAPVLDVDWRDSDVFASCSSDGWVR